MKPANALRLAVLAGLALGGGSQAWAAGTGAGTTVSNTATVNYEVGGVAQTAVDSNTTSFVVDRKINLTVAEVGGATTQVVPGGTARVTTFTVTNTSNSPLDFSLAAANKTGDDFDLTGLTAYVESGATAGFQATEDIATYIDELVADGSATVYVVGDVPAGVVNGNDADVSLTATAHQSVDAITGVYVATAGSLAAAAAESNTTSADNTAFVDTVFADAAGTATGDVAEDGKHSDDDAYTVSTATLSVTKSSTVVSDPFNGVSANAKAIPGAVIEYCLDVNNGGAAAADNIVLTDAIPANTSYVAGSMKINAAGTGAACDVGSGTAVTDIVDAPTPDAAEYDGTAAPNGAVTIRTASIASSARFKAVFRVTVD